MDRFLLPSTSGMVGSSPVAVSNGTNSLDVCYRRKDNGWVEQLYWRGGQWQKVSLGAPWDEHGLHGFVGELSAIAYGDGRVSVFGHRAVTNQLCVKHSNTTGIGYGPWDCLPEPVMRGTPSAVYLGSGRISVLHLCGRWDLSVSLDPNHPSCWPGTVVHRYFDGSTWSFTRFNSSLRFTNPIALVSRYAGQWDAFARSEDSNQVGTKAWSVTGGYWPSGSSWFCFSGGPFVDVTAGSWSSSRLDVMARGRRLDVLWHKYWNGQWQ